MIDIQRGVRRAWAHATAGVHASQLPAQNRLLNDLRDSNQYALIVLDALRYDYAREILPMYLNGTLTCAWSAAHDTFQYGNRCWGDRVYDEVTYVSGAVPLNSEETEFDNEHFNRLYGDFVPRDNLPGLIDAWKDCWDTSLGTVPADALTDYARDYQDADQLVVHYFQPHAPYIGREGLLGHTDSTDAEPNTGEPVDKPLWDSIKEGETTVNRLQAAYRANVHVAAREAARFIQSLDDRRVVVMADHGELLADYGTDAVSHPRVPYPEIRRVPWFEVDSITTGPQTRERGGSDSVADRLEALGYA
jgi:hypothetical protein